MIAGDRRPRAGLTVVLVTALIVVFVAGFVSGVVVRDSRANADPASNDANLRDFLSAYHLVTQKSYFRPFDRQHLIYAAIDGMLSATGDPHTLFLSPQDNQVANTELNGSQFSGIGAIVARQGGKLVVVAPIPHAPASNAGIRAGDIVIKIDGRSVVNMPESKAVMQIHGRAGTSVVLTVIRNHSAPFSVTVKRELIPPITAYSDMMGHGIGVLHVVSFGDTTGKEVSDALSLLKHEGAKALIIDLRDNPGGYVDAAQHVVSDFVPKGVVAYEEGTNKQLQALNVIPVDHPFRVPIVVLVNGGTASAAEITAAALHDDNNAVIMGTRTYGKGSMQSVYSLADGSSIRITDRLWLTPRKKSIQGVGITPDIAAAVGSGSANSSGDSQLLMAERYLLSHEHS